MLVGTLIAEGCLFPEFEIGEDSSVALAEFVRKYGIWKIPESERLEVLKRLSAGSSQILRKKWIEVLNYASARSETISIGAAQSIDELRMLDCDLVVLDLETSKRLGLRESIVGKDLHPEVIKFGQLGRASINSIKAEYSLGISSKDSQFEVWKRRFEPLVGNSSGIKIYDSYLFNGSPSGLEWKKGFEYFLKNLRSDSGVGIRLSVYTQFKNEGEVANEDLQQLSKNALELASGVKEIDFYFVKEGARLSVQGNRGLVHDRYVKFIMNGHCRALSLGNGLEALDSGLNDGMCRETTYQYFPDFKVGAGPERLKKIENAYFESSKKNRTYFKFNR